MTETILSTTAFDFEGLPRYPPRWNWCVASLCDRAASSEISVPLCRQLSEVSPSIRTYASGRDRTRSLRFASMRLSREPTQSSAFAMMRLR